MLLTTTLSGFLFVEKRRLDQLIPEQVRKVWDNWELRILVLISLSLQILLIVGGNRRKYNPATWLRLSIWSAYLMADWVATVALGVLSNKQGNSNVNSNATNDNDYELMAFWAPFMLLHLGGPDTITAYAIADNDLWIRHMLGLGVQTGVALYVALTAWTGTWRSFLTIPMLFAGVVKYGERSLALRSANREQFLDSLLHPPDPGPTYAESVEEFNLKKYEGFSVSAEVVIEVSHPSDVRNDDGNNSAANRRASLGDAYNFFQIFKRLFVDFILSFQDRDMSQPYFQNCTWEDAFTLVEIELGFGYDAFYTKAPIIYTKWGCFCRFITSSFTIIVFVLFLIFEKHHHRPIVVEKHHHWPIDLFITYILLVGAILLEFYAFILLLSSDRTELWLSKHKLKFPGNIRFEPLVYQIISCFQPMVSRINSCFHPIISRLIYCFKPMVSPVTCFFQPMVSRMLCSFQPIFYPLISCFGNIVSKLISSFLCSNKKRWSNSMVQYNLLSFSLKDKPVPCLHDNADLFKKIVKHLPFHETLEKHEYEYRCKISSDLKMLIFQHFQKKSKVNKEKAEYNKYIKSLCSARGGLLFKEEEYGCSSSFDWSTEVEFDQSILIWHIATDLCYHKDGGESFAAKDSSKNLSDYMLYLLVMCPLMLPNGNGMMGFRDTCEEAKEFFKENVSSSKDKTQLLREMLLEVSTEVEPSKVKWDIMSKSVLSDGRRLARRLQKMVETENWSIEKKWEFVCNVWIEILGYAAGHCSGYYHARQLAKGGELLTHVWFLMAHLGITEQFQINRGHARTKLVAK